MLGDMAAIGGQHFSRLDIEAKRATRLKEAEQSAATLRSEKRAYDERIYNERRANGFEDQTANRKLLREERLLTKEDDLQFDKDNPTFKGNVRVENDDGTSEYFSQDSNGTLTATGKKVSSSGNPELANQKHVDSTRKEISSKMDKLKFNEGKKAMLKMATAFKQGNAMSDAAMIFYFMKTLDPTSVVRESEFKTVKDARAFMSEYNGVPLPAGFVQMVQSMKGEGSLLQEQREQILDLTLDAYNSNASVAESQLAGYRQIASDRQWKESDLLLDRYGTGKVTRESLLGKDYATPEATQGKAAESYTAEDFDAVFNQY